VRPVRGHLAAVETARHGDCPTAWVSGRDGHGYAAASMRSPSWMVRAFRIFFQPPIWPVGLDRLGLPSRGPSFITRCPLAENLGVDGRRWNPRAPGDET
jgi:hypothetical protein